VSNARSPPPAFSDSLVADPAEEAFEEWGSKVVVALYYVLLAHEDTVPSFKARWLA
jgi:hypothetical protein